MFDKGKCNFYCGAVNKIMPDVAEDDGRFNGDDDEENTPSQDESSQAIKELGEIRVPQQPASDIHMISVIGQVEGHLVMPQQNKTTKYEHIMPQLVAVEESRDIKGLLIVLNTVGGDVEAGLALAEMIATMRKPTVSLVLGGGHSIGVPIAVAADYSFIAPTATMTLHPIRLSGLVVGVQQSFDYLDRMQDRVIGFITSHSHIDEQKLRQMMMTTGELARDIGTVIVGEDAVSCGLIDEVGGLSQSLNKLRQMMDEKKKSESQNEIPPAKSNKADNKAADKKSGSRKNK